MALVKVIGKSGLPSPAKSNQRMVREFLKSSGLQPGSGAKKLDLADDTVLRALSGDTAALDSVVLRVYRLQGRYSVAYRRSIRRRNENRKREILFHK